MYKCKVSKFPENKNALQSQRYFHCFLGRNSYILFAYVSINVIFAVNSWLTNFKPVVGTAIKWYLLAGGEVRFTVTKELFPPEPGTEPSRSTLADTVPSCLVSKQLLDFTCDLAKRWWGQYARARGLNPEYDLSMECIFSSVSYSKTNMKLLYWSLSSSQASMYSLSETHW